MGSRRLPGKVLKMIGKYPAIYHTYQRTKLAVPNTVVAIPANSENDALAGYLRTIDAPVFRWDGPEDDVLGRFAACLKAHPADIVVRITADCPLVDPWLVKEAASQVRFGMDFVSNVLQRHDPHGLDVEAFHGDMLQVRNESAATPAEREHVTPWMQQNCMLQHVRLPDNQERAHLRWVLDTVNDLQFFRDKLRFVTFKPPHPTTAEMLDAYGLPHKLEAAG